MGVFDDVKLFKVYRGELVIRDRLVGGIPKNAKLIEAWLRSKLGTKFEQEIFNMAKRTMADQGLDVEDATTFEALEKVSEAIADERQSTGFKSDENGIYIEGRQVKAMFKESTNIVFEGEGWGKRAKRSGGGDTNGKNAKSYLAERVFVNPDRIYLHMAEPSGVDTFIGHIIGPKGPQSTLAYYEYALQPHIEIEVLMLKTARDIEQNWGMIWKHAEENGLGAMRSQSFGRFDLASWDEVEA